MYYKATNKEMERIWDRLTKFNVAILSSKQAQIIGRNKNIRQLRKNGDIHIANDRYAHKSIVYIPTIINLSKKGMKYYFGF